MSSLYTNFKDIVNEYGKFDNSGTSVYIDKDSKKILESFASSPAPTHDFMTFLKTYLSDGTLNSLTVNNYDQITEITDIFDNSKFTLNPSNDNFKKLYDLHMFFQSLDSNLSNSAKEKNTISMIELDNIYKVKFSSITLTEFKNLVLEFYNNNQYTFESYELREKHVFVKMLRYLFDLSIYKFYYDFIIKYYANIFVPGVNSLKAKINTILDDSSDTLTKYMIDNNITFIYENCNNANLYIGKRNAINQHDFVLISSDKGVEIIKIKSAIAGTISSSHKLFLDDEHRTLFDTSYVNHEAYKSFCFKLESATLNGNISDSVTTILLNSGINTISQNDYLLISNNNTVATNDTYEIVKVDSINEGGSIVVIRGQLGTTSAESFDNKSVILLSEDILLNINVINGEFQGHDYSNKYKYIDTNVTDGTTPIADSTNILSKLNIQSSIVATTSLSIIETIINDLEDLDTLNQNNNLHTIIKLYDSDGNETPKQVYSDIISNVTTTQLITAIRELDGKKATLINDKLVISVEGTMTNYIAVDALYGEANSTTKKITKEHADLIKFTCFKKIFEIENLDIQKIKENIIFLNDKYKNLKDNEVNLYNSTQRKNEYMQTYYKESNILDNLNKQIIDNKDDINENKTNKKKIILDNRTNDYIFYTTVVIVVISIVIILLSVNESNKMKNVYMSYLLVALLLYYVVIQLVNILYLNVEGFSSDLLNILDTNITNVSSNIDKLLEYDNSNEIFRTRIDPAMKKEIGKYKKIGKITNMHKITSKEGNNVMQHNTDYKKTISEMMLAYLIVGLIAYILVLQNPGELETIGIIALIFVIVITVYFMYILFRRTRSTYKTQYWVKPKI